MLSCITSFYILEINPLLDIVGEYILPYSGFPFHFVDGFLGCAEAFYFDVVPFAYFFLCFPCPKRHIGKNIAMRDV